ncbi:MAG: hypothetical protein KBH39_08200 [Chitinophagales bacterium]|nr:hypothetical protein [Chitinophagales bacterium]
MKTIFTILMVVLFCSSCTIYKLTGVDENGKPQVIYTKHIPEDACDTLISEDGEIITDYIITKE